MSTAPQAPNPQEQEPDRPKLTIKDIARMAGFMVSTIQGWQRAGKVPPAPIDGNYNADYVEILKTYRKNALSAQSRARWDKLTPKERTAVAKKQWTPQRKKTQSVTMRNVRLGLTGMTPEKLKQWNTNAQNAANTEEVRKAQRKAALRLWAKRKKLEEQRERSGRPAIENDPRPVMIGELRINRDWSWPRIQRHMNIEATKQGKKPLSAKGYEACWKRAGSPVPPQKPRT